MVFVQFDKICNTECYFVQYNAVAIGDDHGNGINIVQYCIGNTDDDPLSDGKNGRRFSDSYFADPDHWRIYYAQSWHHWTLYCKNL